MLQKTLKFIAVFMCLIPAVPALAQQPTRPVAPPAGQKAPPDKTVATACARYEAATTAAYSGYIRILKQDMPELGDSGADPAAMIEKLQTLYEKLGEDAQAEDPIAFRKLAAIEIFSLSSQRRPILDMTLRKVCALAKLPGGGATILDMVGCAVISVDDSRRKVASNRDVARQMMDKAKAALPQNAGPGDSARLLVEDVARGLEGCY